MRSAIGIGVLTIGLALAGSARAAPAPTTPEERAAEVAAAVEGKDAARLRELAAAEEPDPWLVADALLLKGEAAAAAAFAGAAPRSDVKELPAFVAAWKAGPEDALGRKALAEGNAALQAARPADALAAFAGAPTGATGVVAARLEFGRALALRLQQPDAAAEGFREAAQAAEALGWLRRASDAWLQAARAERLSQSYREAAHAYDALLGVEARRGANTPSMARAHHEVGEFWSAGGQWERASESYTKAEEVFRTLNDAAGEASAKASHRHVFGQLHRKQGRYDLAVADFHEAAQAARTSEDAPREAQMLFLEGRTRGDLDEHAAAVAPLEAAIRLFAAAKRNDAVVVARSRLAYSLTNAGKPEAARKEVDLAAAGLTAESGPVVRAFHAWAEGTVRRHEGPPAAALESLTDAYGGLVAAGEIGDSLLVMAQMVSLHLSQKLVADARRGADFVLEAARRLGDPFLLPLSSLLSAVVAREEGDKPRALVLAREALAGFERIHHASGVSGTQALIKELS